MKDQKVWSTLRKEMMRVVYEDIRNPPLVRSNRYKSIKFALLAKAIEVKSFEFRAFAGRVRLLYFLALLRIIPAASAQAQASEPTL